MKGIIEGLLYVQGDQGLTIDQVSDILEMTKEKEIIIKQDTNFADISIELKVKE